MTHDKHSDPSFLLQKEEQQALGAAPHEARRPVYSMEQQMSLESISPCCAVLFILFLPLASEIYMVLKEVWAC